MSKVGLFDRSKPPGPEDAATTAQLKDFNATSGAYSLVANKTFSGTHKPYLDEVDVLIIKDQQAQMAQLEGKIAERQAEGEE